MGRSTQLFLLLLLFIQCLVIALTANGATNEDYLLLLSLKDELKNTPDWKGADPCDNWVGIVCTNSRVTSIIFTSMNLTGKLSSEIGQFSELQTLNLIGCSFSGSIPDTIGNLQRLTILSLTNNSFSGSIPASIGHLSELYWLDLAENQLDGPIPVSNGNTPGLDMLLHAKHFHLDHNKLSGNILSKLFSSKMVLKHVLLNSNNLIGNIPDTLGLVQTLEVMFLSNNNLTGPIPNLTGMNFLNYVDMSNNSFDVSEIPQWFSPTLESLTTLMMENTRLRGQVPVSLFNLANLQTVILRNNQLNGTIDVGTTYSNQLQLIDLQNNSIVSFVETARGYNKTLILMDNPFCQNNYKIYCMVPQSKGNSTYSTLPNNCVPKDCNFGQVSSPNCKCAYPYTGTLVFRAPSFSDLGNSSYYIHLQESLMNYSQSQKLPVDSVSLSNPIKDSSENLEISLQVFPSGQDQESKESKNPLSIGIIIGAAAGGTVLLLLVLVAGVYAFRQKRRAERASDQLNPFARWDPNSGSGGVPQLKGARCFSFEELKKYTNKFSEANFIGSGGYGKVYLGTLPTGKLIAIKRAQTESMQGGIEFKTEIELLSRVHHKNLVSLIGFCFDQGEEMLVYEYVPNGTLKDSLSGKSGISLDWMRRLKLALGAARGLAYLHELANPPIIHRDIKSTNILLDEHLNAKVSDFGLSKPMGDDNKGHISTQVKGTMGYMDPEYYMSQQLTEKSDVYSFGVLMLELITARMPIERGKYIVRVVQMAMDKTKVLYNLQEILDPAIGLQTSLKGLEKFVDLVMRCVEESGANRPAMGDVVKEIENIMQLAGLNPNTESTSTSASYEEVSKGSSGHPYSNEGFEYSGIFPISKIDPH
uniref:non-specific serine/threonine protein kinase n=1 Tax=Fagus sylvatica TaxID=28930 RepID=A0A2N9EYE2_FAGSY